MRQMESSGREVEVKLPFDSASAARRALQGLGARPLTGREFEENVLFDRAEHPLLAENKLLRLRRVGARATVTFKAPVPGEFRHKVRREDETRVEDPLAAERIFEGLGFTPTYRYQKFRSEFELGALHICLDETPLGCFVELEGPPAEIDLVAGRLGYPVEAYVRESYRELHEKYAEERGETPGDLVFETPPTATTS